MPEFAGFKSTTLVGKADLPSGSSVVKIPQGNSVIHEYINEPIITSTSALSSTIRAEISSIGEFAQTEIYQSNFKKSSTINEKIVPELSPAPEFGTGL